MLDLEEEKANVMQKVKPHVQVKNVYELKSIQETNSCLEAKKNP